MIHIFIMLSLYGNIQNTYNVNICISISINRLMTCFCGKTNLVVPDQTTQTQMSIKLIELASIHEK